MKTAEASNQDPHRLNQETLGQHETIQDSLCCQDGRNFISQNQILVHVTKQRIKILSVSSTTDDQ